MSPYRALVVAQDAGGSATLLLRALHGQARAFYAHYGFQVSPAHPMALVLRW
ncbi:MAG: hypothetical protein AW10_02974 [Candidatus Accumulibacter appositus]|uniref:GNAT family N-acetyltransferase n=1 Tax=Candidatus Accumulibacter appositus TaxID=1454003 RepID=A0A011PNM4_9PROT|nr:hypothetical protein [Accumulibacter sp.]EXI78622.1 MAG: hypothetical protein AW10_02974 [Candidatus Accumulibacter appositus]HRF03518.1 hypothetical protein [Accumulibacter sp.]